MLKFRLAGYPVRVEWMFWVLCALLGLSALRTPGPAGLINLPIVVVTLFITVLWHELGHAWARKRFRQPYSEIVLYGMGGYCAGPGQFTRNESMLISAAGPAANLVAAVLMYLLLQTPGVAIPWVGKFVLTMYYFNLLLALFNLLPILPMDGGRIFETFMANRNPSIVPKVGFVLAAILAVLGLIYGQLFVTIILGYMAYGNWQRIQAYGGRRGY